jgi:cytochrome c oxidase cbb3-type subunit 3
MHTRQGRKGADEPESNGRRGGRPIARDVLRCAFFAWTVSACAVLCASAQQQALTAQTDSAAVERGKQILGQQCGFCHGANARGGSSGPDLTRSELVQEDENGRQLGGFLRVGRPDRGMPKFDLSAQDYADLAAFLHSEIYLASNRRLYKILDVLVGDPKAGEAYFSGAGRCTTCHSVTGDMKGIGAKYSAIDLQGHIVYPRRSGSPPYEDRNAVKVTVTPASGAPVTGAIVRLTDFEVTLFDPATRQQRSFLRTGDVPKVVVADPLQAHMDQLLKWTDADMHNVTAYLASLK